MTVTSSISQRKATSEGRRPMGRGKAAMLTGSYYAGNEMRGYIVEEGGSERRARRVISLPSSVAGFSHCSARNASRPARSFFPNYAATGHHPPTSSSAANHGLLQL